MHKSSSRHAPFVSQCKLVIAHHGTLSSYGLVQPSIRQYPDKSYFYRPLAVGVSMGVVKLAAAGAINAWALSMCHKYKERVRSSFAVKQNE